MTDGVNRIHELARNNTKRHAHSRDLFRAVSCEFVDKCFTRARRSFTQVRRTAFLLKGRKTEMKYLSRLGLCKSAALALCCIPQVAAQTAPAEVRPQLPTIPQRRLLLTDFGAVGDGKAMNTEAFRKAVAACRKAGGCELLVPAGTFVTGPFELTDRMALVLERGATVRGSENFKDYESAGKNSKTTMLPLIGGKNLSDVEIRGEGTIDGAGLAWWQRFRQERAAGVPQQGQPRAAGQPAESPRPKLVVLTNCTRVRVEGVTLKDSPQFHLVPNRCREVTIEGVKITAPADSPNTDGIDPTGSRDVLIRACTLQPGAA